MEMAGKLAPGRQSCQVNARAAVRCQVAGFGGLQPGLAHAGLGSAASLRCLAAHHPSSMA
jgi:hypothetical protein